MEKSKKLIVIIVAIAIGLASFMFVGKWASDPDTYATNIAALDEIEKDALALTGTAAAAATIAAAIPGDSTTPIANKLMDIAGYMVVVFVAIIVEKYLLTLTGALAFKILIPIACVIIILALLLMKEERRGALYRIAAKALVLGLLLWALVPVSLGVSNKLNETYQAQTSVAQLEQEIETEQPAEEATVEKASDKGSTAMEKFQGILDSVKNTAGEVKAVSGKKLDSLKEKLNELIESAALMIVTTCVVPIIVLLLFVWVVKMITGLPLPSIGKVKKPSELIKGNEE